MVNMQKADLLNLGVQGQLADVSEKPERRDLGVDQLQYMADLIAELQVMAQDSGLDTLAGILALGVTEAHVQLSARRRC
jgi:hypothetical protein